MRKLRELFSDTLVYGISSVFARFVNYLLVPFYTAVFAPSRYGVVILVYAAIAFLNVIFTMGMESSYLRYGKDRKEAPSVFRTVQLFLLIAASGLAFLLWILEPAALPVLHMDPQDSFIYRLMIAILWFDTLAIVPFAELRLVRRTWLFAALKTAHVGINLFLNFYLILGRGHGIEAIFVSNTIASALVTIFALIATLPLLKGEWNSALLRRAFSFGWPFIPAGLGYAVNEVLDRFFLGAMDPGRVQQLYGMGVTPEDVVGIYGACYKVAVFMLLLIQMFRMAWQPFFMRHADDPEAPHLYARAFDYFNLMAAMVYLMVGLFARELVSFPIPFTEETLINSRYWSGLSIVPLLLLAYWFHGWYIHFSAGIFIRERTGVLPGIMILGGVITILINMTLVPLLGMMGAAWATAISFGVMALSLWYFSTREFRVPYRLGRGMGVMAGVALAVWSVPDLSALLHLNPTLVKAGVAAGGLLLLVRLFFRIRSERIGTPDHPVGLEAPERE